jgi:short-subunit dehydrogenase
MKLQGKVAIITGASMGIGEEIAKLFAREGARLVLCARNLARQEEALQRIGAGENAISMACDVSQRGQVQSMVQAALNKFGRIDILVNNAGFGLNDTIAELDVAQCRQLFDTNLFGAMECMQAVVPIMRRQGAGDIVNISSVSGHIATPYMGIYAASKHAMHAIGMAARMELHEHNINVLTVSPGYIATDFGKNKLKGKSDQRVSVASRHPVGPEVVAQATLNGLLKRKREAVVPRRYSFAIKLHQLFPNFVEGILRRSMRPAEQTLAAQGQK